MESTWNPRGNLVESTWNPRGNLVESTWNPRGNLVEKFTTAVGAALKPLNSRQLCLFCILLYWYCVPRKYTKFPGANVLPYAIPNKGPPRWSFGWNGIRENTENYQEI